jgi:hypothetical protein
MRGMQAAADTVMADGEAEILALTEEGRSNPDVLEQAASSSPRELLLAAQSGCAQPAPSPSGSRRSRCSRPFAASRFIRTSSRIPSAWRRRLRSPAARSPHGHHARPPTPANILRLGAIQPGTDPPDLNAAWRTVRGTGARQIGGDVRQVNPAPVTRRGGKGRRQCVAWCRRRGTTPGPRLTRGAVRRAWRQSPGTRRA